MKHKRALPLEKVEKDGVLYVLATTTEDMPKPLREAITRRSWALMSGECLCGGLPDVNSLRIGDPVASAEFIHEDDCVARDEIYNRLTDDWQNAVPESETYKDWEDKEYWELEPPIDRLDWGSD